MLLLEVNNVLIMYLGSLNVVMPIRAELDITLRIQSIFFDLDSGILFFTFHFNLSKSDLIYLKLSYFNSN